ncbi:MAG TPA: lactate dehydrogenase, partial [Roseiarcus sp.]
FALAKAIASGDERLMRKAGISAEIARLERLRDSHFDDQIAMRRKVAWGEKSLAAADRQVMAITLDLERRIATRRDAFRMKVGGKTFTERRAAGEALIALIDGERPRKKDVKLSLEAEIGGFGLELRTSFCADVELRLLRLAQSQPIAVDRDVTALGLVSRLESALIRFEVELAEERRTIAEVSGWLPGFKARLGDEFPHQVELEEKRTEMAELEGSLAATGGEAERAEDAA